MRTRNQAARQRSAVAMVKGRNPTVCLIPFKKYTALSCRTVRFLQGAFISQVYLQDNPILTRT
uniref:Uncharacterized protein n=1 Tax=Anguilla anguilla TaxID=7936 RepID=A0A0E9WDS6_ANGAN